VEQDGTHGDVGGQKMVNQVIKLGKEEIQKENGLTAKV
jgi:hypothetical protein